MPKSDWTAEQEQQLTDLWSQGLSAGAIALRMGKSRNGIIGKAHRLDLPSRPTPIRPAGSGAYPRPRPTDIPKVAPLAAGARTLPQPAPPPPAPKPPPAPPRTSTRRCCWPIDQVGAEPGTPRYRSCDAPVELGARLAYCPEHYRRAIAPRGEKTA